MTEGLVRAQLNDGWRLICDLGIDGYRNFFPRYPDSPGAFFRKKTYRETWEACFSENSYDFLLSDNSLIQFRIERGDKPAYNYSYYECPFDAMSYDEFLADYGTHYKEAGDEFRHEYELYLTSCDLKNAVTPIRYDYNPDQYAEGRHPASHIHFGFFSHVRVGTKKILKPLSFLLLILRQCYPDNWLEMLEHPEVNRFCRNIRIGLNDIEEKYWNPRDENELIFH